MNKLNKILVLAMFSVASLVSNVSADSGNFAGPYIGIQASMAGVELAGDYNDPDQSVHSKDSGQTGMIGSFGSVQAGFNKPLNETAFVTLGLNYTPTGDASFAAKDIGGGKNVTFELSDLMEVFIEPSFMVTSNSAFFLHAGYIEGDLAATGTDVKNKTLALDGTSLSAGLKIVTDGSLFIKAEAGLTDLGSFKLTEITGVDGNTTAFANADTEVAFGAITIGKKF